MKEGEVVTLPAKNSMRGGPATLISKYVAAASALAEGEGIALRDFSENKSACGPFQTWGNVWLVRHGYHDLKVVIRNFVSYLVRNGHKS